MKFDCKYDAMLEIEKIVRHPRNNNMHPIEQIEAFQRIISKKGVWRIPLIISKKSGFLVAGHLRLTVAESMGLERLPVVYQDFESEADEYQFLTFDNEIARWAELNRHEVHLALEEIEGLNIEDLGIKDFNLMNFDSTSALDEMPTIKESDSFTIMTFTVTQDQKEEIEKKINEIAKNNDFSGYENPNKNGNALYYMSTKC